MNLKNLGKFAVPLGVVGIIVLLIAPLPAALLDLLIVVNISLGLVVLLTAMYVKKPLEFSVFPSILLVLTLFRLGLNVASSFCGGRIAHHRFGNFFDIGCNPVCSHYQRCGSCC